MNAISNQRCPDTPVEDVGPTLAACFAELSTTFRAAEIGTPELDARLLLCHALDLSHEEFVNVAYHRQIGPAAQDRLKQLEKRRLAFEPVSRIVGYREFWGRRFQLGPAVLDPRPDTETLIEAVLSNVVKDAHRSGRLNVLDLGTGSGAILITLLRELPQATGTGTDISAEALKIATANAKQYDIGDRVRFIRSDWLDKVTGRYDIVVANPPYIPTKKIAGLAREVSGYDPEIALNGGESGLEAYHPIIAGLPSVMKPGATVFFEIGPNQASDLKQIFYNQSENFDLSAFKIRKDLDARPRCVSCRLLTNRKKCLCNS